MTSISKLSAGVVITGFVLLLSFCLFKTVDHLPRPSASSSPVAGLHLAALLDPRYAPEDRVEPDAAPALGSPSVDFTAQTVPEPPECRETPVESRSFAPRLTKKREAPKTQRPPQAKTPAGGIAQAQAVRELRRAQIILAALPSPALESAVMKEQFHLLAAPHVQFEKLRRLAARDAQRFAVPRFIRRAAPQELR